MHIAFVSPYDPRPPGAEDPDGLRGGVEQALDRAASGLARRGHKVTVVCSSARAGTSVTDDGVRFVRVRRHATLFRTPVAWLARHVPHDADVVHVPATYPFVSDWIPIRESLRGRPTVLEYHFDVYGTSLAMRAAAWLHARTLGHGMWRATRIVTKSLDYAAHSKVLSHVPRSRLDWVPNGVDVDDFHLGPKEDFVLCVGRLVPYKGVDVLVRAMPEVARMTGARLVVVGDGPLRGRLEALACRLEAPVTFLGRVGQQELRRLYAAARVCVLPSVNSQEAFGISLLESMASGTPVVASDLPGVREVARLAGRVAPSGDSLVLADMIVRTWCEPKAFGAPAQIRKRVEAQYGWDVVLDRLEAVYRRAVQPGAPRRPTPWPTRRPTRGSA